MSVVPVDQCPAPTSPEATTPARASVIRSVSVPADAQPTAVLAGEVRANGGLSGSTALSVGAVVAAASTVLAVQLDLPGQIALVAGYITLAATACLCVALVARRYSAPAAPAVEPASEPAVEPRLTAENPEREDIVAPCAQTSPLAAAKGDDEQAPDSNAPESQIQLATDATNGTVGTGGDAERERGNDPADRTEASRRPDDDDAAWKRVGRLRVADAARLWCGLKPGHHATEEVMTWASTMLDAVERGELPKSESTGILAQYRNGWHTEIPRDALKAWATSNGHSPRFLDG